MKTLRTLLLLCAPVLTIISSGAANAQWTDRETPTRITNGVDSNRVAMSLAGPSGGGRLVIKDTTASPLPTVSKDGTPKKQALVGSWLETVTFPPETGRPQLKSLVSFHSDETMVTSDQGSVTTDPPTVFSAGQGAWTHLKERTFAYTLLELISDLSGNLVGFLKVRGTYAVSDSGDEYTGSSFAEVFDADGGVLFSVDVTNVGRRIRVELP